MSELVHSCALPVTVAQTDLTIVGNIAVELNIRMLEVSGVGGLLEVLPHVPP
jgi:hypothetical protein